MRAVDRVPPAPRHHADLGLPDTQEVAVWRFSPPMATLSSATVGGGWRTLDWLVNIGVVDRYRRTDLDAHVAEVAETVGLSGAGAALLTAADVSRMVTTTEDGVTVDATVGVTKPTWAADEDGAYRHDPDGTGWRRGHSVGRPEGAPPPGTINLVVRVPVTLTPAAAVNAVITATEAKSQALAEASIPGTGTASDAVVIVWPTTESTTGTPAEFCGPRSPLGARIGRAVHRAMSDGLRDRYIP